MTPFKACGIIEGFSGEAQSEDDIIDAYQSLIDSGVVWELQGCYGRTAMALIASGQCHTQESVADRRAKNAAKVRRNTHVPISRQR